MVSRIVSPTSQDSSLDSLDSFACSSINAPLVGTSTSPSKANSRPKRISFAMRPASLCSGSTESR
eukprot:10183446-Alexandrium_andersonii.AAC.1